MDGSKIAELEIAGVGTCAGLPSLARRFAKDLPIQLGPVFLCLQTADDSIHLCLTGSEAVEIQTSPVCLSSSS